MFLLPTLIILLYNWLSSFFSDWTRVRERNALKSACWKDKMATLISSGKLKVIIDFCFQNTLMASCNLKNALTLEID